MVFFFTMTAVVLSGLWFLSRKIDRTVSPAYAVGMLATVIVGSATHRDCFWFVVASPILGIAAAMLAREVAHAVERNSCK